MCRDTIQFYFGGICARCMEECASCAASLVNGLLSQYLVVVAVIRVLLPDHINESRPTASNADDLISLARCAYGDGSNRRVEPWDITATCQNADYAFFCITHRCLHDDSKLSSLLYNFPCHKVILT